MTVHDLQATLLFMPLASTIASSLIPTKGGLEGLTDAEVTKAKVIELSA